jgi:hypothetical protein
MTANESSKKNRLFRGIYRLHLQGNETLRPLSSWRGYASRQTTRRPLATAPLQLCLFFIVELYFMKGIRHNNNNIITKQTKQKPYSMAFNMQANYADWATAAGRRIWVPPLRIEECRIANATDPQVILVFPLLLSRGWMNPVPYPLFVRQFGRVGNRTRDLCVCSQEFWPLDQRGGQ